MRATSRTASLVGIVTAVLVPVLTLGCGGDDRRIGENRRAGDAGVGAATDVAVDVGAGRPRLWVTPNPVDFGRVAGGDHAERSVTLTNVGNAPLALADVFVVGGNGEFSVSAQHALAEPVVLATDERYELVVSYDPLDDGYDHARLVVQSNHASAEDGNTRVDLVGNAAEPTRTSGHGDRTGVSPAPPTTTRRAMSMTRTLGPGEHQSE